MRPISPIVVCGPRLRTRTGALHPFTTIPTRPSQDEMHGVGRSALAYDNFVRLNLNPFAMLDQPVSILRTAERFGKPLAQGAGLAVMRLVRLDNRVLTRFKGSIEIGRHNDVVGNKSGGTEGVFHLA